MSKKRIVVEGGISTEGVGVQADLQAKFLRFAMKNVHETGADLGLTEVMITNETQPATKSMEELPSFDDLMKTPEGQAFYNASAALLWKLASFSKMFDVVDVPEEEVAAE